MDAELREYLDERFERIDHRFERAEETARHTLVVVEGLRHEVHLIAEAYVGQAAAQAVAGWGVATLASCSLNCN